MQAFIWGMPSGVALWQTTCPTGLWGQLSSVFESFGTCVFFGSKKTTPYMKSNLTWKMIANPYRSYTICGVYTYILLYIWFPSIRLMVISYHKKDPIQWHVFRGQRYGTGVGPNKTWWMFWTTSLEDLFNAWEIPPPPQKKKVKIDTFSATHKNTIGIGRISLSSLEVIQLQCHSTSL